MINYLIFVTFNISHISGGRRIINDQMVQAAGALIGEESQSQCSDIDPVAELMKEQDCKEEGLL